MYNVILQDDGTHAPWCNCPRCGENAISREEIDEKFGTRVMANEKESLNLIVKIVEVRREKTQ